MDDGGDELHLLLIALGQLFGQHVAVFRKLQAGQPALGRLGSGAAAHAPQFAEIDQLLKDLVFGINSPFLGHIAHTHPISIQRLAVPEDVALVLVHDAEDHADGGGFPRPVGADKAENPRFVHGKADGIHRFFRSKRFADMTHGQAHVCVPPSIRVPLLYRITGGFV